MADAAQTLAQMQEALANGAEIDWDKISEQIAEATKPADPEPEAPAEGVADMPEDLLPLYKEKLRLDKQVDDRKNRIDEIKDTFGKSLKDAGLQGYTLGGKVKARRSPGTRTSVDSKKLREQMPEVWAKFMKLTHYVSIRITP